MNLSILERTIGYRFGNKDLLKEALTHRSYLNENPDWKISHNERLEFLGDAVLELVVTEELYNRYPDYPEGKLTPLRAALVNFQALAQVAGNLDLNHFLLLSKGEARNGSRAQEAILANVVEALVGAVYLDADYKTARQFINQFVMVSLAEIFKDGYRDAKSLLQEKTQAEKKITPTYKVLKESGPEHQKIFKVGVYFNDKLAAAGEGHSKHEAELEAAKQALEKIS